ncbi:hypothetical protein CEXT_34081 [Caerostris extrusa]|uniref:Uncharacterized protein n=1 Tax=Caerostris extrusa TaxID=172846 RepID=A0AAV4P043_CAEEX|nr:hypothetical protein CEXT_34081 [Caerostris extrusa]
MEEPKMYLFYGQGESDILVNANRMEFSSLSPIAHLPSSSGADWMTLGGQELNPPLPVRIGCSRCLQQFL